MGGADRIDGGYGWLVVLASFFAHVQCLGTLYTFTLYVLPYQREFGFSSGAAVLPGALATGTMLVSGPFVGLLTDRIDARGVFCTLAVCQSLGLLLISLAETPALLIASHVLMGFGMSLAPSSVTSCQQWFDKKRALASGIGLAGSGMGQFVMALVISGLIKANGGDSNPRSWRRAIRAQAMLGIVILVPCALLLRRPRLAAGEAGGVDQQAPATPATGQQGPEQEQQAGEDDGRIPVRQLISTRSMRTVLAVVTTGSVGYMIPFIFLSPFLREAAGLDAEETGWAVSIMGIANIVGRVVMGAVADHVGRRRVLQVSLLAMIVSASLFPSCSSLGAAVTAVVIPYGVCSGSFIAMPPSLIAQRLAKAAPHALGTLVGLNWLALSVGASGGPPLAGLLLDASGGSWHTVLYLAAASFVVSVTLLSCWWPSEQAHTAELVHLRASVLARSSADKAAAAAAASVAAAAGISRP